MADPALDWGTHKFAWKYDEENSSFSLNLEQIMNDALNKMRRMEEDATLDVVIRYLRTRGYTVTDQAHVQRVINAWVDAGTEPWYHYEMQEKLREQWPVLASAVAELVKANN